MQNVGMNKYGIMIMSFFAAIWFAWGLSALGQVPVALLLAPVLISGTLIAFASRIPLTACAATRRRVGQVVSWASAVEGLAIFAAVNVLHWTGHAAYAPVAAAAIVGLHFLPLAHFLGVRAYYVAGAVIVALALGCCAIGDDVARTLTVGIGTAVVLWVTCLAAFARGHGARMVAG
jgi:hypothetical protein